MVLQFVNGKFPNGTPFVCKPGAMHCWKELAVGQPGVEVLQSGFRSGDGTDFLALKELTCFLGQSLSRIRVRIKAKEKKPHVRRLSETKCTRNRDDDADGQEERCLVTTFSELGSSGSFDCNPVTRDAKP